MFRTQTLPSEFRDTLLDLGWSAEWIDDLTQKLADADPAHYCKGPYRISPLLSVSAYLDAEIARDDLSHAIQVRIDRLSQPVAAS